MVVYRLSFFEEKHMMAILLYIYRNGETAKCVIYDNVSHNSRMSLKLDRLKRAGLVTMRYGMPTYVSLTDKGRYLASKMDDIENNMRFRMISYPIHHPIGGRYTWSIMH